MLDTIILQIPFSEARISNPQRFTPIARNLLSVGAAVYFWKNNATPTEKKQGIYRPRLTIIKRGGALFLKIEFSAPNILFGNNLDELEEADFPRVIELLRRGIEEMGVNLFSHELEGAPVISFHAGKNIILSGGYTADFVIGELYKVNIDKTFDLAKTIFENNGQSLQIYTNSHSFVVYDKIADMGKLKGRAIDKDQTAKQMTIFDDLKSRDRRLEVVRFEVRLSKAAKMRAVLKSIGYWEGNPVFRDIFYKDLCQRLVMDYWDKFFGSSLFIFSTETKPQNILRGILMSNPKMKAAKAIQLTGLKLLCKDDKGIRGLRATVEGLRGKDAWTSVNREITRLGAIRGGNLHGFVGQIRQGLKDFKALKLANLPCKEL